MSDPGRYPVSSSAQRARLDEYDRWLRRPGVGATVMRWLMGPQGAFVVNGPLLRLRSELGLDPTQRVLDIGCGRTSVLRFLDDRVRFEREPVGLDFSEAVLALARRDEAGGRRRSALVRGGATTLPFAERAFELVLCGYVAKHLDDDGLRDLLDEIWRVLAPGGLALILGVRAERASAPRRVEPALDRRAACGSRICGPAAYCWASPSAPASPSRSTPGCGPSCCRRSRAPRSSSASRPRIPERSA